jgi:sugar lactone lactonase YvrE
MTPAHEPSGEDDGGNGEGRRDGGGVNERDSGGMVPAECSECCRDGVARGPTNDGATLRELARLEPSPTDVTTCPDGRAFLTVDGPDQVWRVPEEGPPVHHADVTGVQPAGIACDDDGRLFVVALSLRRGSPFSAPGVLLLEAGHAPQMLPQPSAAAALSTPNGIAAASGIGVYVTDTLGGVVALIREQGGAFVTTIVARDMLGVNGVAYDGAARTLYVSNSFDQRITSFTVASDGSLSEPSVEWTAPGFAQLDGLVVDELGRVYVAGWGGGQVLRLPGAVVLAEVPHAASLAFRGGSLLIVEYHLGEATREGGLHALDLGACAAAP